VMSGLRRGAVINAIRMVTGQWSESAQPFRTVSDYDVANVSKKVARIVTSYVDYVNRTVWHKPEPGRSELKPTPSL
jgi:UDP-N-acetylglucosamine 2-epimerase (non-hydrolysing)